MKGFTPQPKKSEVWLVIGELLALGLAPIPVVPRQYSEGFKLINGKCPSYFENSKPKLLAHKQLGLHDRLPTEDELKLWFSDPRVGVGSFGSADGLTCWIDFDAKHFESKKDCRRAVAQWREENGIKDSWTDESGGGGYRVLVRFDEKPEFTRFALSADSQPVGEILGKDNFCVLAPSLHHTGNRYQRVKSGVAGNLRSAEAAGLYPIAPKVEPRQTNYKPTYQVIGTDDTWSESDWARSYLQALQPWRADDHDCWLRIGIALRSTNDPSLLDDWIEFSKQSSKFKPGECERKWGRFKPGRVGLGTLHFFAVQDGWENTRKKEYNPEEFNWQRWIKLREYTPDVIINQRYFSFPSIPTTGVIVGGKSGLGTGKTEGYIEEIKRSGRGSRLIGYRNNLLIQTTKRATEKGLTYHHLHKDDSFVLLADSHSHVAFCLDSITHSSPSYFEDVDIILDESVGVLLHAVNGGTLGESQSICLELLKQALENCERVFCLDGNLRDIDIELIRKLSGNKQIIKIQNSWRGNPHEITIVEGFDIEREVIKKRDRSPLLKLMMAPNVVPWISTDSLDRSKILCRLLTDRGKTGYVLNSETSSEDWAKECLENTTAFIERYKPDFMIISPSGESGIDAHGNGHFTHKFTLLSGVLTTNSQTQLMFRLRDNIPHFVFCPEKGQATDRNTPKTYSAKKFQEIQEKFILQSALLAADASENPPDVLELLKETSARSNDDYWQYSNVIGALDQYEIDNLRKCLIYALEQSGHKVSIVQWEIDEDVTAKEFEVKDEVQITHAKEVFNSADIDFEQARALARSGRSDKDEQRQIEKAFLLNRLPGIKESEQWTEDFILERHIKNREFISQQERFWLVQNLPISAKRHEVDWFFFYQKEYFYKGVARKSNHSTIWALQQLGITRFFEGEWHKESPEVLEVCEKGNHPDIALALGFSPNTETANAKERIEYLKRLLKLVGVEFGKGQKKTIGEKRLNVYSVNHEVWNNPDRLTVLEAIGRKFTDWFKSDNAKVSWFEPSCQNSTKIASTPQPEPVSATVQTPPIIYRNGGVWTLPEIPVEDTQDRPLNLSELIEVLPHCDTPQDFAAVIDGVNREMVRDAFLYQEPLVRKRLEAWLDVEVEAQGVSEMSMTEVMPASEETPGGEVEPTAIANRSEKALEVGDRVRVREVLLGGRVSLAKGLEGVVRAISTLGRLTVECFESGLEYFDISEVESMASG